jgi:5-methylcytosine-specific restriction endonuclease McrA
MTPHDVVSWQEAITLYFRGKIEVLEEYAEVIRSPSIEVRTPAVARLARAALPTRRSLRFSRSNVFARDAYRCQYCGKQGTPRELTYDHVLPRRLGGRTLWENIVTACVSCNRKKGGRTPDQAGLTLLRTPVRPTWLPPRPPRLFAGPLPNEWTPYCV